MAGAKKRKTKKPLANTGGSELIFKEDSQMYAKVQKTLGDRRFRVLCDDAVERTGRCRGKLRRGQWVAPGAVVLVSTRDFDADVVDILELYTDEQARQLKRYGETDFDTAETEEFDEDVEFVDDVDVI